MKKTLLTLIGNRFILLTLISIFIPSSQLTAATVLGANLVKNPSLEIGDRQTKTPNYWKRNWETNTHSLEWVNDPDGSRPGKVLKSEFVSSPDPQIQNTCWESEPIKIRKDTWYEISVWMAYEDIRPILIDSNNQISLDSNLNRILGSLPQDGNMGYSSCAGVQFYVKDSQERLATQWYNNSMYINGPTMTDWDEAAGVYRTFQKQTPFSGWKRYSVYYKTAPDAATLILCTRQYPPGRIYFDNFSVREVIGNYDPSDPGLKRSGRLNFIQYQGKDFFPIILGGFPAKEGTNGTQNIDPEKIKEYGFNTVLASNYINDKVNNGKVLDAGSPDDVFPPDPLTGKTYISFKQWLLDQKLAVMSSFWIYSDYMYHKEETAIDKPHIDESNIWLNDPEHKVDYMGSTYLGQVIDKWVGFPNLFSFFFWDENSSCSNIEKYGYFLTSINGHIKMYNQYHSKSSAYAQTNLTGHYTGIASNNSYYLPYADIVSITLNVPAAYQHPDKYSGATLDSYMQYVGVETRKMIKMVRESEAYKGTPSWFIATPLGAYNWSSWDGTCKFGLGRYVPFNLQRFQLFDQIINGATGAWFCGSGLNDYNGTNQEYFRYHHRQMYQLTKELKQYYDVLLEPNFYDEWSINDPRIEAMLKKHEGKIYLFTASVTHEDIKNVTITLNIGKNYMIDTVIALNDVANGDKNVIEEKVENPNAKREIKPISANSFQDDFTGEDDNAPQGIAAPGYAVHIYEITLAPLDNTPPTTPVVNNTALISKSLSRIACNNWSASDPESGIVEYLYKIYSLSPSGQEIILQDWKSRGIHTSVIVNNLALNEGTTYYFAVKAKNGVGLWSTEGTSNGIEVITLPQAPSNLNATADSRKVIRMAWQDNSHNEQGFRIQRRKVGQIYFQKVAEVGPNANSFTDNSDLVANATYEYRVRAYNEAGVSALANTASATARK